MNQYEQNLQLAEYKKKFLSGQLNIHLIPQEYRSLVAGWEKSASEGADPHIKQLTDDQRDTTVFSRMSDMFKWHFTYFRDYYDSRNSAMAKLGCAIFYIDSEMVVFNKGGDSGLLEELKARGIRIGAKLSVQNVGVFAGNTALSKPFVNCLSVGQGHYTDILCDYACVARYGEGTDDIDFQGVRVVFIPMSRCNRTTINSVFFILEAGDFSYNKHILYPHVERRMHLIEQSASYSSDMMMLCDSDGEVVFMNNRLSERFSFKISDSVGKRFYELVPELSFLRNSLASGTELSAKDINITFRDGTSSCCYIDCIPILENSKIIGLKISIKTNAQLRKYFEGSEFTGAIYKISDIAGSELYLQNLTANIHTASASFANVLITGESGTGKELVAQAIHTSGPRCSEPFITIDCTLSQEVLETALFGYESYGTSVQEENHFVPGKLEQANRGTVFFDEISELSPEMQSRLLRFFEDGTITRIGGTRSTQVDVKILVSSGKDLLKCVESGSFRRDLYYRLNVININIPPLRERRRDIEPICKYFLPLLSAQYHKHFSQISKESLAALLEYNWPGNIRELKNILERSVASSPDGELLSVNGLPSISTTENIHDSINYHEFEASQIMELMFKYGGNKSKLAKAMGISRGTLYKRLRELGFDN